MNMRKLLVCSDSFKGTLSSLDIASISENVVNKNFKDKFILKTMLIADGGEGSLEAFEPYFNGEIISIKTVDAENQIITAPILINRNNKEAFFEVSSIVGLPLIKNIISPLKRTTKGIGIVIKELIQNGYNKITIALGGSSTSDLGIGMMQELGVDFGIKENLTLLNANKITKIDTSKAIFNNKNIKIICLSDVTNPLLGHNGANYVFAKQKGYSPLQIENNEKIFIHIASLIKRDLNKDLSATPKLGAAGGLSGAFYTFFNATIKSGIDELMKLSDFENECQKYDLIITGEGCFDNQSLNGKVVSGILKYVNKDKLIIICGKNQIDKNIGIKIYETSNPFMKYSYIKRNAKELYKNTLIKVLNEN